MLSDLQLGTPAQELTIEQCHEVAGHFYDQYTWETNDRFDLWCAGMAKYLTRIARFRGISEDKTVLEVSENGTPFRRLAYIEFSIPGMVQQMLKEQQGERALEQILEAVGLDK